ncbi:hypothetical protein LOZ53_004245 [Ophidiomyces ophidiicola]|nr:hypothetical protein LOZ53_004245 [Ophidiomyces ophidiicola]
MMNEALDMRIPMPPPQFPHPPVDASHRPSSHIHHLAHPQGIDSINNRLQRLSFDPRLERKQSQRDHSAFDDDSSEDEDPGQEERYQGWSLYRASIPNQDPDWSQATRSKMNLGQDELSNLVKEQKKANVAKTYNNLGRIKRRQVDGLIEGLKRKDGRFNYNVVYIRITTKEASRRGLVRNFVTTAINLVLEKTIKPGASLSPRTSRNETTYFQEEPPFEPRQGLSPANPQFQGSREGPPPRHPAPGSDLVTIQRQQTAPRPPMVQGHPQSNIFYGSHAEPHIQPIQQQQQQQPKEHPRPYAHPPPQSQPAPHHPPPLQPPPHPHPQQQPQYAPPPQNRSFPPTEQSSQVHAPAGLPVINGPPPQLQSNIPLPAFASPVSRQNYMPQVPEKTPQMKQINTCPQIINLGKTGSRNETQCVDQWPEVDSSNADDASDLFEFPDDSSETDGSFIVEDFRNGKGNQEGGSRHSSKSRGEHEKAYRTHRRPAPKDPANVGARTRDSLQGRGEVDLIPAKSTRKSDMTRSASVSHPRRPPLRVVYDTCSPSVSTSTTGQSSFRYPEITEHILRDRQRERDEMERQREPFWKTRPDTKEINFQLPKRNAGSRESNLDPVQRPQPPRTSLEEYDQLDRMKRFQQERHSKLEAPRHRELGYNGAQRRPHW